MKNWSRRSYMGLVHTAERPNPMITRHRNICCVLVLAILVSFASFPLSSAAAAAALLSVNSTADTNGRDANLTLREALLLVTGKLLVQSLSKGECGFVSNSTYSKTSGCSTLDTIGASSADTIVFSTSVFPSTTPATITIGSTLPDLSTGSDMVDGSAAGVNVTATSSVAGTFPCFRITSSQNVVKGVDLITKCSDGVIITTAGQGNTIGGSTASARNIISGNTNTGVTISGSSTTSNSIKGNYIGTNAAGNAALANNVGVLINSGAQNNSVGSSTSGDGNLIAFNRSDGVKIDGSTTTGNAVRGNSIYSNAGLAINTVNGGNTGLAAPIIANASTSVTGTACPGCTVDIYSDSTSQARSYEGSTIADTSGAFTFARTPVGPNVTATATNASGNTSMLAASVVVDATPPDTQIVSGPSGVINTTSASFSWTGSDNRTPTSGLVYSNKLDQGNWSAYSSATSTTLTGLSEGSHAFSVQAKDQAGNVDPTPAQQTFTVDTTPADTTPPDTTINSGPFGFVNTSSASFTFSANEAGSTFACALDAATFSPCTSPASYSGLADGGHTFAIRATDVAGNTDPSPATQNWTIDTLAPAVPTVHLAASSDTGASNTDNLTANNMPTFQGDAEATSLVHIFDGSTSLGSVTADGQGHWSFTVDILNALSDGAHAVTATATDIAQNTSAASSTLRVTIDTNSPPAPTINSPANNSYNTSGSLRISGTSEASSKIEIVEGATTRGTTAAASDGTWSVTLSSVADGSRTYVAIATDAAGNRSAPSDSRTVSVDTVVPNTTIDSMPSIATNETTASFTFSADDPASQFECALDSASFSSCISPASYSALVAGSHTFAVRAVDPAGNTDPTPASYSWTVDTTAPDTIITGMPPALTNSSSASFSFSSSEAGSTFQCRLDGSAFAVCASPADYNNLAEGHHTFEVEAIDPAGNADATPASYSWAVDMTAPVTSITGGPAALTNNNSASFSFSSNEAGSSFQCRLDSGTFASCTIPATYSNLADAAHTFEVRATDPAGNTDLNGANFSWTVDTTPPDTLIDSSPAAVVNSSSASFSFSSSEASSSFQCRLDGAAFAACANPVTYSNLADGSHTFQVRAVDTIGNNDATPASYSWTIDTTTPVTVIDSGPPALTNSTGASFTFHATKSGSTFECKLDGGVFASCTSPASYSGLADGTHTFAVRSTDPIGNTDPSPATYSWTIDTTPPDTTIVSSPAAVTNSTAASFSFSSKAGSSFQCSLDGAAFVTCGNPVEYNNLADGAHTFAVRATDPAGNTDPTPISYSWSIDTVAPTTSIISTPPAVYNSASASFSFGSNETGASFQCRLDGSAFATCSSPKSLSGLADGGHTFEVKAIDAAGNIDPNAASYSWTVDTVAPAAPVISSPANNSYNTTGSITLSGTAEANSTVTIFDGTTSKGMTTADTAGSWSILLSSVADGTHTYTAKGTDAAGNTLGASGAVTVIVDTVAPNTTIDTGPSGTVDTAAASFTFSADEIGSTFACALDGAAYSPCTSPLSYTDLANGPHTFTVRATDTAGNTDPTPASRSWTVAATVVIMGAGDIACGSSSGGDCKQMATSDLLVNGNPRAVLPLGDDQYECGSLSDFNTYYNTSWGRIRTKTYPAVGNHEYNTSTDSTNKCYNAPSGAPGYYTYFGNAASPTEPGCTVNCKGYYSYDLGGWHIIALNSNCSQVGGCGLGSPQEVWLRNDLAAHPTSCTLAYWHYPRFTSGTSGSTFVIGLKTFWQDLYNAEVELVLNGHDHDYERFAPQNVNGNLDSTNGIREIVVGTGGKSHESFTTVLTNSEVRNSDTFGVLKLTLRPGVYDWQFVPIAGKTFTDSGSTPCH